MVGRITGQVDFSGLVTSVSYDNSARMETTVLPGGATRIVTKYADGRTKSITGTAVVAETYEYGINTDGSQWIKKYTGPNGSDSAMWIKTTTDLLGRTVRTEKPGFGGAILSYVNHYDSQGRLWKTEQLEDSIVKVTEVREYDALGAVTRSGIDVDNDGQLTLASIGRISDSDVSYAKEGSDWLQIRTSISYPLDNSTVALTNLIVKTRLTGLGSSILDLGLLTSENIRIDAFGNAATNRTYIDRANKTTTQLADMPTSTQDVVQVYVNGLPVSSTSAQSVVQTFEYDDLERRTAVRSSSDGGARSVAFITHHNGKNQIDWTEDAAGNRVLYTYDADTGRRDSQINSITNQTFYAYDLRGAVTNEWGAKYPVEYGYDEFGRMETLKTFREETGQPDITTWLYDEATGLPTSKRYADNKGPTYDYWPDGKLKTRTWPRGSTPVSTIYSYDSLGQLTNINYSAEDTPDITYTYDRTGKQKSAASSVAVYTYDYDAYGTLTNETIVVNDITNSIVRFRDDYGRNTGYSLQAPGSTLQAVSYGYDDLGRFEMVASTVGTQSNIFTYSWMDGANLLNGYSVPLSNGTLSVSYDYEPNRNHKTVVLNEAGTNLISRYEYLYDKHGRRTRRMDSTLLAPGAMLLSTNFFGYNTRDEVTSAVMNTNSYSYGYDDIGNRISHEDTQGTQDYIANELNQYTLITNNQEQITLSHDSDGNLLSDGKWNYSWNGENRLIAVEEVQKVEGSKRLEFAYDYMGRRISKGVFEWDSSASLWSKVESHSFLYDGWNLMSEEITDLTQSPPLSATRSYVWGLDLSETLQGAGGVVGLPAPAPLEFRPAQGDACSIRADVHAWNGGVFGFFL